MKGFAYMKRHTVLGAVLLIGCIAVFLNTERPALLGFWESGDDAVCFDAGYWNLFRYNPTLEEGKLTIDSKDPTGSYQEFIANEARYSRLAKSFPERAEKLFAQAEEYAKARHERLVKMGELYK